MLQSFIQYFSNLKSTGSSDHYLLAVSGGVDSIVLFELARLAGLSFTVAHCNFSLRGKESDRDEEFVRSLGKKHGVEVLVKKFDTKAYMASHKLSVQEAARELRYHWFTELHYQQGFAFTVTAHHADDNIETLLMNFFRGTGLQGLTAMPEWNFDQTFIIRPLLNFRRQEIVDFALKHQLDWCEDSSNVSSKYTRNFFRNELIPALKNIYPKVEENLLGNIDRFKKINQLYQLEVAQLKEKLCMSVSGEVRIPWRKLMMFKESSLIYEIIKDYGFSEKQVDECIKLMESQSGKYIENENWQIIKHRNWLVIAPRTEQTDTIMIREGEKEISFLGGRLKLRRVENKTPIISSALLAQLDAAQIEFPLLLRKWKQGDYFYPLGMRKKKKIARFFIDQKLSKNQKEDAWVLESSGRIIWVVGMRIDDRFRISDKTRSVLEITFDRK